MTVAQSMKFDYVSYKIDPCYSDPGSDSESGQYAMDTQIISGSNPYQCPGECDDTCADQTTCPKGPCPAGCTP